MRQGFVHGLHIFLHDLFALASVGATNGFANGFNRLIAGKNCRDGEEANLENRIHAAAHAGVARDLVGIDHEELCAFGNELLLHLARQTVPNFVFS